ncbi:MAG: phage integrase SAM-like domain-containing protein [Saprospiraceae bacterium]
MATPFRTLPKYWSDSAQRIRNTTGEPLRDVINSYLVGLEADLSRRIYNHLAEREPLTIHKVRGFALEAMGKPVHSTEAANNLCAFADTLNARLIDGQPTRKGKRVTKGTVSNYKQTAVKLRDFVADTGRSDRLNAITTDWYRAFVAWLNAQSLGLNTVGKHVTRLKMYLAEADAQGADVCQDYRNGLFTAPTEDAQAIALSLDDLEALESLDLSDMSPMYSQARDLFLIGAFTGLRWSDIIELKPENFKGGYIQSRNKKSTAATVCPILPPVQKVLQRNGGGMPPLLANQVANRCIKELCKIAGLDSPVIQRRTVGGERVQTSARVWELVTTHTARRSFITNARRLNIENDYIQGATGHTTTAHLDKYKRMAPKEKADAIREAFAKTWEGETPTSLSVTHKRAVNE